MARLLPLIVDTMLGNTAIARHPEETRHSQLHGKFAIRPFSGRKIPIICDAILVKIRDILLPTKTTRSKLMVYGTCSVGMPTFYNLPLHSFADHCSP